MSRDIVTLLYYEAKKRPDVADLIARVGGLTDEEIDTVPLPLPWYRKALRQLRDRAQKVQGIATTWDEIEPYVVNGTVPDADGVAFRFEGDTAFVTTDGGGQLQVNTGHLVWFPMTGGVWIEEVFTSVIDPRLMLQVSPLGPMTRLQFKDACRQRILRTHGITDAVQEVDPGERSIGGFTFKVSKL